MAGRLLRYVNLLGLDHQGLIVLLVKGAIS